MFYRTTIDNKLKERIDHHSKVYSFEDSTYEHHLRTSIIGVCGAYTYLCQSRGLDNVPPFHLLKMDNSNKLDSVPLIQNFKLINEEVSIITTNYYDIDNELYWVIPDDLENKTIILGVCKEEDNVMEYKMYVYKSIEELSNKINNGILKFKDI